MSSSALLAGTAISTGALAWLAATDPKRRRTFGLGAYAGERREGAVWAAALLPGAMVATLSGGGGLVIWLGAVGVAGWVVSAIPPGRLEPWTSAQVGKIRAILSRAETLGGRSLNRLRAHTTATQVTVLERRIAELETQLESLRAERRERTPLNH